MSYLLFSAQTPLLESVHLLFSFFLFFLSLTPSQTHTYISYICLKSLVSSDKLITGSFVCMADFINVVLKLGTLKISGLHITIKMFYYYKKCEKLNFSSVIFLYWHLLANKFFPKRILPKGKML